MKTTTNHKFLNDDEQLSYLLSQLTPIISNKMSSTEVGKVIPAEELKRILDLNLLPSGSNLDSMIDMCQKTLKYSPSTNSKYFMDKLYAGTSAVGIIGELMIALLNTNVHVYHVSPVATLMEKKCIDELCKLVGFQNGSGIMNPGGSHSNLTAMVTARNYILSDIKQKGITKPLAVFTSNHSHYSIDKAAMVMGIGLDNVIKVPTINGQMDPEQLDVLVQKSKEDGLMPFFVNCTSGTTVLGAFDPIDKIAQVCRKHQLWCHVDGSWGGPVVFSSQYKHLLKGIEHANSVTINPHKLMGVPVQCSVLLMFSKDVLLANSLNAQYLFHGSEYDMGDFTLGCGRRADGVKLFMSWMYFGHEGFEYRVDHSFAMAKTMSSRVNENDHLLLLTDPAFVTVCFYYVSSQLLQQFSLQDIHDILMNRSDGFEMVFERLEYYTISIHKALQNGKLMIDYAPLKDMPKFFRIPFISPELDDCDMKFVADEIVKAGLMIEESMSSSSCEK
eukprot:NODE_1017_length_2136_cov_0.617575.p1 type:complete len:501 gc:universal NODE_1017_length_2136_cov_0.617575:277-1779(+)